MNFFVKFNAMNRLVSDINAILLKHGVSEIISIGDISVTDKIVTDNSSTKLSNAIVDYLWPRIPFATVYHYTQMSAAENILSSEIFRLNNIAARYNEGEIRTFCETHKLTGYLEKDQNGDPKYKQLLMPNTFYASFTDTNLTSEQEEVFWGRFASCNGVRLKIEITASNPNFRKMYYEKKKDVPIELLSELVDCVRNKHKREFVLQGISRLCCFYLSGEDYGIENEYRALHRVWEGDRVQPISYSQGSYIELPVNVKSDCGYHLKIIEVHGNAKPRALGSYPFSKRCD